MTAISAMEDRLLTIAEVAALTGLAVGTLYHLVSQRRIPVVRISRRCIRFRLSAILKWWDELSEVPVMADGFKATKRKTKGEKYGNLQGRTKAKEIDQQDGGLWKR